MKAKYKVRNWPEYNKALKDRGRITVWFNENSVQNWSSKKKQAKKVVLNAMPIMLFLLL